MNINRVAIFTNGTTRNSLQTQVLASTVETEFQAITDTGTAIALLAIPLQTAILGSGNPQSPSGNASQLGSPFASMNPAHGSSRPYYSSQQFDYARPFLVRVAGVATPASNSGNSLTVSIYSGTSKSGTKIATTGAAAMATTTTPYAFLIETQCFWDSAGQVLLGQQWYSVNGTTPVYNTWKTNTATATVATLSALSFVATATWGNAAGGSTVVGEFSISQL